MQVSFYKNYTSPSFKTNCRSYTKDGNDIGTQTYMFREDLNWREFTDLIVRNFRNKDKVNIVQFAASDGSEAYTQIISLLEKKNENVEKFFPIMAYDIDPEIVNAANSKTINLMTSDIKEIKRHTNLFYRYFASEENSLLINNNNSYFEDSSKTYRVSDKLTDKVKFHNGDMMNVLKNIEDNSNTVIMCRNILGYDCFSTEYLDKFTDLLSEKLKSGSIFVIGDHDTKRPTLDRLLQNKRFRKVMNNVYRMT